MIKLENYEVMGWEHAIRGMRNPMNSWEKSDSTYNSILDEITDECVCFEYSIGPNDHELMMKLAKAGPVHGKFRRMITVYVDVTAPLYWWKEFDTYKVGTVANSCSTMHKIHSKHFTIDDFSYEHLMSDTGADESDVPLICVPNHYNESLDPMNVLSITIHMLNAARIKYLETKDKKYWWQMIQLLPSSYNQKRTVQLNYEVLANIYQYRKDHKLDEWREFCEWIEQLPYSEIITGEVEIHNESPVISSKGSGPNGIVRPQKDIDKDRKLREKVENANV